MKNTPAHDARRSRKTALPRVRPGRAVAGPAVSWLPGLALLACSNTVTPVKDAGVVVDPDGGGCPVVPAAPLGVASHPHEGADHTGSLCAPVCYGTNPPSSGTHFPTWASYKTYDAPVPWGFLVHCLEHGAIVVVYNCPDGCAAEVDAAKAWIPTLPVDPACGFNRVVLAPDPTLDVRWAAAAWHWTWRGDAFDAATLTDFFHAHYDQASEHVCDDGVDLSWKNWCDS